MARKIFLWKTYSGLDDRWRPTWRPQKVTLFFGNVMVFGLLAIPAVAEDLRETEQRPGEVRSVQAETDKPEHRGLLPGNRVITGTVEEVRSNQIKVDIGQPKSLFLPLKSAQDKHFSVKEGDKLEIVLNDHNAIVDYHPLTQPHTRSHRIVIGQLAQPLTVGHDKAVIQTEKGEEELTIASRARSKLSTIPIGKEASFLIDETNQIVDANPGQEAVVASKKGQKPPVKGAHRRVEGILVERIGPQEIKIRLSDGGRERIFSARTEMDKLDRLQANDRVVLLVDSEDKVVEIATPEVPRQ